MPLLVASFYLWQGQELLVASLLLVAMPFVPSSFLLLVVSQCPEAKALEAFEKDSRSPIVARPWTQ